MTDTDVCAQCRRFGGCGIGWTVWGEAKECSLSVTRLGRSDDSLTQRRRW
jgi:hypothetical protein